MISTMSEIAIQAQIDAINKKLDLILEEVYAQREMRQSLTDLADDASIIGKDIFKNTVIQLDKAGVELNAEALTGIGLKLVRNIDNINEFLEMLESINDFMKDVGPIIHQVGLDAIHKLHELEQKGYIDFFRELSKSLDNIVTHFSAEDVKALSSVRSSMVDRWDRNIAPTYLPTTNTMRLAAASRSMTTVVS